MNLSITIEPHSKHRITLVTHHSRLAFSSDPLGFTLSRSGQTILASGAEWGTADAKLGGYTIEEHRVILDIERLQGNPLRLTVSADETGWCLEWNEPTRDTFSLASGKHWYGQGELVNQGWPLDTISQWEAPFITWDNGPTGLGDILTPLWLSATGAGVLVENACDSLQVGFNAPPSEIAAPQWSLEHGEFAPASFRPPLGIANASGLLSLHDPTHPLRYRLIVGEDLPTAYLNMLPHVGKPGRTPPEALLRQPIWTTWARYKTFINQKTVLEFAQEIRDHGFPGGTLEIDDKWQPEYGDTWMEPRLFPEPREMVRQLNELGFAVTVWIVPFLSRLAENAKEAAQYGYLVRTPRGEPYLVKWWQDTSYLLDITNPAAVEWWRGKLETLQREVGLAGYKFDAGEANYLPADAVTHTPVSRTEFSSRWVEFGATYFPYCEARCGWFSQRHPILFRHWDKFSTWGLDNGLASVITTALALSITGYPFVLPDMIGGNAYAGVNADKELMIRWTQASAPMLAIQFSLLPWDYDAETVEICRKYANLHVDLAGDRIAAARQAVETGQPVIRPVFWAAPNDPETWTVKDAYLMGDKYLVAPVVTQGATARDIYLPAGRWRDYWSGVVLEAGWQRSYPAPLDTLPLFVRLD